MRQARASLKHNFTLTEVIFTNRNYQKNLFFQNGYQYNILAKISPVLGIKPLAHPKISVKKQHALNHETTGRGLSTPHTDFPIKYGRKHAKRLTNRTKHTVNCAFSDPIQCFQQIEMCYQTYIDFEIYKTPYLAKW